MSNTKQQIEEMLNKVSEYNKLSGKGHGDLKDNCYICGISPSGLIEAIDRLVTEARIEENNRMQVEKLNLSKLTTDHAEGYNMCATDSNFRIHNRIAELQSQLTNKDTK